MSVVITGTGQVLHIHDLARCQRPCPYHAPSDHHMRFWPTNQRGMRMFDVTFLVERICAHGIGHPDPDDLHVRAGRASGVHGCDGCCSPPRKS